ncbi:3-dehydroquinate dehydratase [Nonlabens sp. MIC269]|uniref:type II 3-dehydroquinate dehydratase n=1 Tax=Nonlabens sp. MIC269 TaxID=1476901 RepID=UPI00072001B4|nr:type II 3-dehydroquinate dehydratase [Nonlabens sp. MIC269]ALM21591.1 3-dehydroquinate dehydratase [Nonlabens sp. MIC269]
MKVLILNGPNLNLLGKREPEVYGAESFDDYLKFLRAKLPHITIEYYQSNVEGELINRLHQANDEEYQAIILNAGAYTHTSVALGDAVAGISIPVVEVHISNVMDREEFRHVSYISKHAVGVISGFGLLGYELGMHYLSIR